MRFHWISNEGRARHRHGLCIGITEKPLLNRRVIVWRQAEEMDTRQVIHLTHQSQDFCPQ
jgi:hypothetical protein